ncbi:uncharacterized protein [Littorina saxatilis]
MDTRRDEQEHPQWSVFSSQGRPLNTPTAANQHSGLEAKRDLWLQDWRGSPCIQETESRLRKPQSPGEFRHSQLRDATVSKGKHKTHHESLEKQRGLQQHAAHSHSECVTSFTRPAHTPSLQQRSRGAHSEFDTLFARAQPQRSESLPVAQRRPKNIWIRDEEEEEQSNRLSTRKLVSPSPQKPLSIRSVENFSGSQTSQMSLWTGEEYPKEPCTWSRKRRASSGLSLAVSGSYQQKDASSHIRESDFDAFTERSLRKRHTPLTAPSLTHLYGSSESRGVKHMLVAEDFQTASESSQPARTRPSVSYSLVAVRPSPSMHKHNLSNFKAHGEVHPGLKHLWLPEDFQPSPASSNCRDTAEEDEPPMTLSRFSAGFQRPSTSKWESFLDSEDVQHGASTTSVSSFHFHVPQTPSPSLWTRDLYSNKAASVQSFSASKVLDRKISSPCSHKPRSCSDSEAKCVGSQRVKTNEGEKKSLPLCEMRGLSLLQPFNAARPVLSHQAENCGNSRSDWIHQDIAPERNRSQSPSRNFHFKKQDRELPAVSTIPCIGLCTLNSSLARQQSPKPPTPQLWPKKQSQVEEVLQELEQLESQTDAEVRSTWSQDMDSGNGDRTLPRPSSATLRTICPPETDHQDRASRMSDTAGRLDRINADMPHEQPFDKESHSHGRSPTANGLRSKPQSSSAQHSHMYKVDAMTSEDSPGIQAEDEEHIEGRQGYVDDVLLPDSPDVEEDTDGSVRDVLQDLVHRVVMAQNRTAWLQKPTPDKEEGGILRKGDDAVSRQALQTKVGTLEGKGEDGSAVHHDRFPWQAPQHKSKSLMQAELVKNNAVDEPDLKSASVAENKLESYKENKVSIERSRDCEAEPKSVHELEPKSASVSIQTDLSLVHVHVPMYWMDRKEMVDKAVQWETPRSSQPHTPASSPTSHQQPAMAWAKFLSLQHGVTAELLSSQQGVEVSPKVKTPKLELSMEEMVGSNLSATGKGISKKVSPLRNVMSSSPSCTELETTTSLLSHQQDGATPDTSTSKQNELTTSRRVSSKRIDPTKHKSAPIQRDRVTSTFSPSQPFNTGCDISTKEKAVSESPPLVRDTKLLKSQSDTAVLASVKVHLQAWMSRFQSQTPLKPFETLEEVLSRTTCHSTPNDNNDTKTQPTPETKATKPPIHPSEAEKPLLAVKDSVSCRVPGADRKPVLPSLEYEQTTLGVIPAYHRANTDAEDPMPRVCWERKSAEPDQVTGKAPALECNTNVKTEVDVTSGRHQAQHCDFHSISEHQSQSCDVDVDKADTLNKQPVTEQTLQHCRQEFGTNASTLEDLKRPLHINQDPSIEAQDGKQSTAKQSPQSHKQDVGNAFEGDEDKPVKEQPPQVTRALTADTNIHAENDAKCAKVFEGDEDKPAEEQPLRVTRAQTADKNRHRESDGKCAKDQHPQQFEDDACRNVKRKGAVTHVKARLHENHDGQSSDTEVEDFLTPPSGYSSSDCGAVGEKVSTKAKENATV